MLKGFYTLVTIGLLFTLFITFEGRAYAYVDPGSSLALFQGASSILMGVLYYFRKRLKELLLKRSNPPI